MLCMAQPPPPPPLLAPPHDPAPVYNHLSAHLAQQLAALPPFPQRGRGHGRASPAPAPAPVNNDDLFAAPLPVVLHNYNHLPAHFAQQLAALPPLSGGNSMASLTNLAAPPPLPPAPAVSQNLTDQWINKIIMCFI
jgi:hypothetical protein